MTAEPVFGGALPWFPVQVDVRVAPEDADSRLELPLEPNTAAGQDPEILWLGPNEWLFVRPDPEPDADGEALARTLGEALAGVHHSAIDVSSNRAAFDLLGSDRLEVLSKGCGLDLHPRAWRDGRCAQTMLATVPVILHERASMTRVLVRPSYVPYLDRWLGDSAPR